MKFDKSRACCELMANKLMKKLNLKCKKKITFIPPILILILKKKKEEPVTLCASQMRIICEYLQMSTDHACVDQRQKLSYPVVNLLHTSFN